MEKEKDVQTISHEMRTQHVILNQCDYRNKVLGCWMGKNIGGTLGAPFEWKRQCNNVTFYTQHLTSEPLPNDDLDIQLLWLVALEERGIDLTAQTLSEYWVLYVTPHWSEYGTAKINMRSGLMPPLSGILHNDYKDSCGAFIRSEIWACIAPGAPHIATQYAYEDAILDHGNGEGTYAEVFCATLESAAFVVQDIEQLIDIGLSYIPAECSTAGAIRCAREAYHAGNTWQEARDAVLAEYRGCTPFGMRQQTSEEDWQKGFGDGKLGWDAPSNLGMLIIGLLYGEGDFAKSICTAVNCGEDTDCTSATVGSIFGIMRGIDAIPQEWITPIGRTIKTACLNLGELGLGAQLPADVDSMTARIERITQQVLLRHNLPIALSDQPTDLSDLHVEALRGEWFQPMLYRNLNGPVYHFDFFDVAVDYGDSPLICDQVPKKITLRIYNNYKVQANINIHWYLPGNWWITPACDGNIFSFPAHMGGPNEITFEFDTNGVGGINRLIAELTVDGRPTVMLVPIVLKNGNFILPRPSRST